MKNSVFPEPTDSSFEFIDAIDLEDDANGVTIIGKERNRHGALRVSFQAADFGDFPVRRIARNRHQREG